METMHNKECKLGSTLNLVINTDCIWTFNGKIVTSKCDPNKGFQKENALFSDSGRYECKVDGKVLHVFDVVIYDQYECNNGSTISLVVNECIDSLTWTLNGDEVTMECDLPNSFVKKNAGLSDSGRYECKVDGKVKYAFDVTILDSVECMVGKTTNLDYPVRPTWTLNGKTIASANETTRQFELKIKDFSDNGIYKCKIDGKVRNMCKVHVYDYLFQDEFIGIRTSLTGETLKITDPHPKQTISKDIDEGTIDVYKIRGNTTDKIGIAVIVAIENFTFLKDLEGMKSDVKKCEETFQDLDFKVEICKAQNAEDVLTFIKQIATDQKDVYDCFVLYFSSHGGHGFVCCKDYETEYLRNKTPEKEKQKKIDEQINGNQASPKEQDSKKDDAVEERATITTGENNKAAKGYILIDTLIELFLPENCPALKEKPKLFFFDCCRVQNKNIAENPLSPIRDFLSYNDRDLHYADILIGYGTNPGDVAYMGKNGSVYTNLLTAGLKKIGRENSIADVMVQIDTEMKKDEKHKQFSTHRSFLHRKLVLGKVNYSDAKWK